MSQKGSTRVYILARELGMESKDLLDLCKAHGIDVKNQLSSMTEEQRDEAVAIVKRDPAIATATPLSSALAQGQGPVRNLPPSRFPVLPKSSTTPPLQPTPPSPAPVLKLVYDPEINRGIAHLLDVCEKAGFTKLETLHRIAEIDPECALFKIRKVCEVICRKITGNIGNDSLATLIDKIQKRGDLSRKACAYLDHIRTIGNLAVHPSDDPFDSDFDLKEVDRKADDLAHVLKEYMEKFPVIPNQIDSLP